MNTKQLRPVCSLGMFDLLKGITIIAVIIFHSFIWVINYDDNQFLVSIVSSLLNFLLYSLTIAAGFGIRKRTIKKCALQLKKMFLIPYLVTGIATIILYSFNYYFLSADFPSTFKEGFSILLSFATGKFSIAFFGGYLIPDIGPIWFVVALAGGWFILNLILNYSQGWKRNFLVLLASLIGYFGNLYSLKYSIPIPFCFFYMFVYVLGLYIGYLAKENNWFEKKISPIITILIFVSLFAFVLNWKTPYVVGALSPFGGLAYPLGILTPYAAVVVCFGIAYLMTHINRHENIITNIFEPIGNNSITILCIHTVETIGMHWYWFRSILPNQSNVSFVVVTLIYRLILIGLDMLLVSTIQKQGGFNKLIRHK